MQAATGHNISNALSGLIGLFCVTPVHGLASLTGGADLDFERTFKIFESRRRMEWRLLLGSAPFGRGSENRIRLSS